MYSSLSVAFKAADPTPFQEQTKPTLEVNFRGTLQVTEALLPMLLESESGGRIVNVASMAGKLRQLSPALQREFSAPALTIPRLHELVDTFERDVASGTHAAKGWGRSNYGFSKLAVIASTKVHALQHPSLKVNCCCPGYCQTDMSSNKGPRPPSEGAKNAVILATMDHCPTGAFYENERESSW